MFTAFIIKKQKKNYPSSQSVGDKAKRAEDERVWRGWTAKSDGVKTTERRRLVYSHTVIIIICECVAVRQKETWKQMQCGRESELSLKLEGADNWL